VNTSLYQIGVDFLAALDAIEIDEDTGEVLNMGQIEDLNAQFETKAESIACYIKNLSAFSVDLKTAEESMKARRQATDKKVDALKKYLTECLNTAGKDKVETVNAKISFRASTAVQIADESALPSEFLKVVTETKPDKTLIKKAITDGREVPGASLIQNRNIQIK
jgi:hypothetical protein